MNKFYSYPLNKKQFIVRILQFVPALIYWAALSLSFRRISIHMFMNIIPRKALENPPLARDPVPYVIYESSSQIMFTS